MKRKRILASFLAAVLLVSLLPAAFATEASDGGTTPTTYTLTINNTESGYTYVAYQIFTGKVSGEPGKYTLADVEWGSSINDSGKAALAGLAGISDSSPKAVDVVDGLIKKSVGASVIAKKLNETTNATNSDAPTLTYLGTPVSTQSALTNNVYQFTFEKAGYYFIKNTAVPSGTNKTFSDCILQVVGNVTVDPKIVLPTIAKQVQDETTDDEAEDTEGWGESADHEINESFKFRLIAEIPSNAAIDNYEKYTLIFNDTMDSGITFEQIESVKIGEVTVNGASTSDTATDGQYVVAGVQKGEAGKTWTLTIPDAIKALGDGKTASDLKGKQVVVVYSAHLNENANIVDTPGTNNSTPNKNKVSLKYSNYPHVDGSGDGQPNYGETTEDYVHVFTYGVKIFKYHKVGDTETPLTSAGFKLYKNVDGTQEVKVSKSAEGVYYLNKDETTDVVMYPYGNTDNNTVDTQKGYFTIKGLDVGTYYLKEVDVPTGYNSCTTEIKVGTSPNHKETADGSTATVTSTLTVDGVDNTTGTVKILNSTGATLPTTGSIGTTIFYVLGSILVIGAVVLLVSKKRMNDAE